MSSIKTSSEKKLMLFSGRAYPELADEVADYLDVDVTPTSAYDFANGEIFVRFEESVRGSDAFVLQSHANDINKWVMEQLIMVDALKRASAKRITVVMPFYPYARQDKKHRGREPISARLIADLFKTAGAHRLMAVDLHTSQIQGFFDGPVDHLFALPLLAAVRPRPGRRLPAHGGLAGRRPGPGGRALDQHPGRHPAGVHPQDARPARPQRGDGQQGRRRGAGPHLRARRRHDRHRRHHREGGRGAVRQRRGRRDRRRRPTRSSPARPSTGSRTAGSPRSS